MREATRQFKLRDRLCTEACIHIPETCLLRLCLFSLRLRFAWTEAPSETSGYPTITFTEFRRYGPTTVRFCLARH